MHFFGQETVPEAPGPVGRPLRTYEFFDANGENRQVIEANFVKFEAYHVTFWLDRPEPNVQDTLVLAEAHNNVTELREMF